MQESSDVPPPEWDLAEWERALTINVGTVYVCRRCGNVVMVTKGGVGVMEMTCCGDAMDKRECRPANGEGCA